MSEMPPVPDPEKVKQTVANSRRSRQEMELAGLQLELLMAQLEQESQQKRMKQLNKVLSVPDTEAQISSRT
ncbi:hypothetical protein [Kamptonema formosum]|uniref:hypothetical protein n=1 Tax=Kamptonema formosum TaxID=331992 RepID=UPI00034D84F6|nr:hypothetical protein [Oscillatoria sp. PCC 10802]